MPMRGIYKGQSETRVYTLIFLRMRGATRHEFVINTSSPRAPRMRVVSVYFRLNVRKLYHGPIRLLADHGCMVSWGEGQYSADCW